MRFKSNLIFFCTLAVYIRYSHGCEMDNVSNWLLAQHLNILDVYRGELFSSGTTSISGINAVEINQDLNRGPYFDFVHENSEFFIRTNDAYADYEEYETETSISATVYFNCVGGTMRSMVFVIGITDTNNNDPQFRPTNELDFTVVPPLPPGFEITGCWNDIITRDIDLTTQRVDFEIFDSPYFEIAYDAESSTVAKEFKARLRTTTFIRSISEPLVFTISATDVDLTNDAPRTTYATVRIISDGEFELPEEPVFSETFYTATYTDENQVVLDDNISLRQGFHVEVEFTLEGEHSEYFRLVPSENAQEITIGVTNPLPVDLFALRQIFLIVNAERNHTSGASATVVLQLPEEETLNFQQPSYEGSIVDNILQLYQMVLTQGYDAEPVSLEIISEHASFFSYTIQQNLITLTMTPLPPAVIEQNSFLNLQVVASTSRSSASTIVILDIVKDDGVTPVFQRTLYEGTYDPNDGLTIDQIVLVQGYDNTVQVTLEGEHAAFFELLDDGPTYTLNTTGLTPDLFREQNVLLTVVATKPRTVGANAAIAISLPAETQLEFEQQNYKGVIEDNILELSPLILSQGYESGPLSVQIQNGAAHVAYFTPDIEDNRITIVMSQLPDDIIQSNTLLNLQVVASTEWSSASTVVTLEIIKDDNVTPVFERTLYEGSYNPVDGLTLAEIVLVQGYDATVQFYLNGDHATFFQIDRDGGHINLTAASIPESLFNERNILLSVEATKPRTVGAHTAISIDLPTDRELRFATETQSGTIRDNILTIGFIDLNVGYTEDVNFTLTGDYASYFNTPNVQSQVSLELREQLPETAILENNFLLLSLTASATNAVSASITIVLEIVKEDTITPRFNQDIFFATYTDNTLEIERIYLRQGFDSSVTFRVDGEFSQYFRSTNTDNEVFITLASSIPEQVIFEEKVLTFSVLAEKELTVGAVATVSVRFPTELTHPTALRFSKNIYVGSLEDNTLSLENIILEHGLTETTDYTLTGDFSSSFTYTRTANGVIISTVDNVPPEVLANKFITLELQAEGLRAVPVTTAIIIDVIQSDEDVLVAPVFNQAYYRGVYTTETGLHLEEEIYLTDGFDETVRFELEGEFSQWFNVTQNNNSATISNVNSIPDSILEVNNNLLFTIFATKPETNGRAVIFVDLPKETSDVILGFDRINYVGSIEDNSVNLDPITLIEGYSSAVSFSLHGDLANYFTPDIDGSTVRIILNQAIPETSIPANRIITLEIQASAPSTLSAFATIVLEVVQDDVNPPITPVFSEAFYVGSYSTTGSFVFDSVISIADGYDATIEFVLEGEHAQWFRVEGSGNSVTIGLASSIPPAIVASNNQLVFAITAHRAGSVVARSAIVISLSDEITSDVILGFDRINYVGSIEDNSVNLDPITLIEGYSSAVSFSLHGDLANYFIPDIDGSTVRIILNQAIPETSIPANRIITLEIQASAPSTLSAFATIVLEVVQDDVNPPITPVFSEAFYVGSYSTTGSFVFDSAISIADGYDATIEFVLEGEHAQWFRVEGSGNSVTIGLASSIPPAIVASNNQLVFAITAHRAGSVVARSAIVISLSDEITSDVILGFDRINYVGSIEDNSVNLDPITLIEGYSSAVSFSLHGDLANYFIPDIDGSTVRIILNQAIPETSIPANRIITLEIQASAPSTLSAFATIVLEVVQDDVNPPITPVFSEAFYVGSYSTTGSFVFDSAISIADGYDATIEFVLEGEHAQWFRVEGSGNSVTIGLASSIPPAIVASNNQLVFAITAHRAGSVVARSAIVISLSDEITSDVILGFDRINYVGSIEDNSVNLDPITLIEGYSSAVSFSLHGDLANYFIPDIDGSTVRIILNQAIPETSIPANRIITLEIQASAPSTLSAFATIVLEVVQDDVNPPITPVFSEAFYVGSYSTTGSFVFDSVISIADGYDATIEFVLEGEHAQWFRVEGSGNSVTIGLASSIPPAIVASNNQLVFAITAHRAGSVVARSAIVISLSDEITSDVILGFDRINYVGSIEDNSVNLDPITLIEGYSSAVSFSLHGDLANYFIPDIDGSTVRIILNQAIPETSIPANRIITLEIQASAPSTLSAFATIVLEVVQDDVNPPITPVFSEAFYVGSYSTTGSFVFDSVISIADGYDATIEFVLEGEHAQWFRVEGSGNSVTIGLASSIPPAIVASNNQLVFAITAHRAGSVVARSAIVISLSDEITSDVILGFDRINYVGSIEDNSVNLDPITLIEGYSSAVSFSLHGDLANYFIPDIDGSTVRIILNQAIPETSIPANRIITLEIQASAPSTLSAFATIVLEVVQDDVNPPITPVFSEAFYVGSYSTTGSFVFDSVISIADGYDATIEFVLEGEHAQWFRVEGSGNSVTIGLASSIPPAIVASNNQLVFAITAHRAGSVVARSAIVISLSDEITSDVILGFDRINYVGSIEDNSVNLDPITLIEGYSSAVSFSLHGDLANYFIPDIDGSTVRIILNQAIPETSIPANRIIMLEIQASAPSTLSAFATIVLEVVQDDVNPPITPVFSEAFYVGSYSTTGSFVFDSVISIADGYDATIEFVLEGEHAQWFRVEGSGNSVTIGLASSIPPAIVASNNQLVFAITAHRAGSVVARSAIVISLSDEITSDVILGFDRINYVGSIEDNSVNLDPITLIEGYSSAVSFSLHGDLANYFIPDIDGSTVRIILNQAIPETSIPANRIITLEIQASAPSTLSAFATIVLEVVQDDVNPPITPVFSEAFYVGSYSTTGSFVFDSVISIADGYDSTIEFVLEGEHAQWFRVEGSGNSVTIGLASSIPPAIVASNNQLVFAITAHRAGSVVARSAIVISLSDEITSDVILGFDRINYVGSIEDNSVNLDPITLIEGYSSAVSFSLHGDLTNYFTPDIDGSTVSITLNQAIPETSIPANRIITLEIQASAPSTLSAFATIVLEVVQDDVNPPITPVFSEAFYVGSYSTTGSFVFDSVISIADGYDATIEFVLEGEHAQWFRVEGSGNSVTIGLASSIPPAIVASNNQLVFAITAHRAGSVVARSAIVISLSDEITSDVILGFDRINYVGSIEDNSVNLDPITLIEGYSSAVSFSLHGDLANYFTPDIDGSTVRIILNQAIPETSIPANRIITLEIQASAPSTLSAFATIVLEVVQDDVNPPITPVFSEAFYVGSYSTTGSFVFDSVISIADGYDATIEFVLEGEHAQWFRVEGSGNSVTIGLASSIPPAIVASNNQLVFAITAHRAGSVVARSAIVISLSDEITSDVILGFDRINYVGSIEDNSVNLDPITLIEGYSSAVSFSLHGDLANYFTPDIDGSTVRITLNQAIPETSIPANRIITLEIQASAPSTLSAFATIVLEIVLDESPLPLSELAFDQTYYIGTYTSNNVLLFNTPATLAEGYDGTVRFALSGDYQEHFYLLPSSNTVSLGLVRPLLPNVIADNQKLVFVLTAERPGSQTARATIIIVLEQDISSVIFDKVLYEGIIQSGVVQHETITITGFEGSNINLAGVYASLFTATLTDGTAIVRALDTLTLPADVSNVVLELRVANSGAVLVLEVSSTDGPELPTVTFDSGSYALRVEIGQVGLVGRVQASADNNEDVVYSLIVNNDHLRARISINSAGEILLTAPANSGVYNFEAVATTVFTQVPGSATIHLSVEALTVCGDETVTAPLIVIDRDEEQPLRDLVLLDSSEHVGCRYTLANRWPANQNWLYVDETGLHATAIDREHPSIAFMALSQIQVELTLVCDSDVTRTKRSTDERLDWLGPYDYGTNTWLLGETIRYNSRRSIVNLIVNDINDNYPIFIGKENEPIIVGYPIPDLEETVLPRSLAELQATDADVGINAALVYWSSEPELAVSPATGFVHVTSNQRLEQDQILTVSATDLNGEGLTGSITLMVKLLDSTNIAVVTVRDAFLEDESQILGNISNAIGYEVRSLRSVVVSDAEEVLTRGSRTNRESTTSGASLEVHVYGLIQREPVSVEKLADDINNAAVVAANIASIQSLQDHLDGRLICDAPGRDTGLLVSTIILSVLLFLLIVAIIAWFVLKRIQKKNYDQFSDANSLASQNESPPQPPKPLDGVAVAKPRLNIEELKRSEKRLQDMLNAPIDEVNPEPSTSETNAVTKIPLPDPMAPIVIQDKLKDAIEESDDDEFGERKKARRKSVVTFNENVEKIIHVDEEPDVIADPNYEVYKL